jgi:pSer/pThr/pTyr-binding forkhead associated (FHA) protein
MPTLRSVSGWPDIPVDHPTVMVGRHAQSDARLDSQWVSRRHCILTDDGGEVVVRDLGSTNGTSINGRRVERGRLKPSDEMSIAHIRYRLDGAPTK